MGETKSEVLEKPLTKKQKRIAVSKLDQQGATFFTYGQLQTLEDKFGPNAKIAHLLNIFKKKRK